jgi:hypothetical protein
MNENLRRQLGSCLSQVQIAVGDHPDADTLTSFQERKLTPSSRASVAEHLSICPTCREVLALSASSNPVRTVFGRLNIVRLAAAAALILVFAVSASRIDDQVAATILSARARQFQLLMDRRPMLSYILAESNASIASDQALVWRVRNRGSSAVVETSADAGRTWRPANLNQSFEPKAVGFKGSDVWVSGASGAVLVSRDAGRHWVRIEPLQTR